MTYDDELEIPEGMTISNEKNQLLCLSLAEYNNFINMGEKEGRSYYLECVKEHLKNKSMTPKIEPLASFYDIKTNSIQCKEGYTFNEYKCKFEKVKQ